MVSQLLSYLSPGLNFTLPAQTIRLTQAAITYNKTLVDSDILTTAGAGTWVSNIDASRIGGTYQYLVGTSTLNSLSGSVNVLVKSKLLIAHQVWTDSASGVR